MYSAMEPANSLPFSVYVQEVDSYLPRLPSEPANHLSFVSACRQTGLLIPDCRDYGTSKNTGNKAGGGVIHNLESRGGGFAKLKVGKRNGY
jgi:hypothetical protein